ncbi:receptor-like protein 12 [Pyrus ussuriensis x Pyrus communis]|uniref:Receptor-like protein 12 n=1 Tax=Pyrus ussuriensis x Pyrus communis TaxID=2448454 RepID=A0A5N5G654_9ROSA|nr:receptor-like protein 12 [Pyrus ussuriensis x Pyrus communis]
MMSALPCCNSRIALRSENLLLMSLLHIQRLDLGCEKEIKIGATVVCGMVLSAMRSLAMSLALTSGAAFFMVLSIPTAASFNSFTYRGLTSRIMT